MKSKMKATEQYFPAVLFIMLNKVVLTLSLSDQIITIDPCFTVVFCFPELLFCTFQLAL